VRHSQPRQRFHRRAVTARRRLIHLDLSSVGRTAADLLSGIGAHTLSLRGGIPGGGRPVSEPNPTTDATDTDADPG